MQEWNAPKPTHEPLLKSALQLQKASNNSVSKCIYNTFPLMMQRFHFLLSHGL